MGVLSMRGRHGMVSHSSQMEGWCSTFDRHSSKKTVPKIKTLKYYRKHLTYVDHDDDDDAALQITLRTIDELSSRV
jgi:hypothetical protein